VDATSICARRDEETKSYVNQIQDEVSTAAAGVPFVSRSCFAISAISVLPMLEKAIA
jgi:hypothetical protein